MGLFVFSFFFVCVCVMILMVCGCLNADEQPAAMQRGNPASSFNHPLLAGWIALSVCLIHRYLAPPAALLAG
jgi:hypothetical protein